MLLEEMVIDKRSYIFLHKWKPIEKKIVKTQIGFIHESL